MRRHGLLRWSVELDALAPRISDRRKEGACGATLLGMSYFENEALGERKRARTRARLLDAAARTFAERGIEAASVNEIAAAAQVVNGTFYYYFEDKAALVDELGHGLAAILVDEVFASASQLTCGVDRVAFSTQQFIHRAMNEPCWSELLARALQDLGVFRSRITSGLRKDVEIGLSQGAFTVLPSEALLTILLGVVAAAIRAQLEGQAGREMAMTAAEHLLLLLGVSHDEARDIAERQSASAVAASIAPSIARGIAEKLGSEEV